MTRGNLQVLTLRHAAALALVAVIAGCSDMYTRPWILMRAPKGADNNPNSSAQLSKWDRVKQFDSYTDCQREWSRGLKLVPLSEAFADTIEFEQPPQGAMSECVSVDDPRLKESSK